jgi:LysM repeat protein
MPEVTLSLPVVLGLIILLVAIGAGTVYAVLQATQPQQQALLAPSGTPTHTPTITLSPTATTTSTPEPSATPLPPLEYTVANLDTCLSIAYTFHVDYQSIILLNKLPAACDNLVVGQKLLIPQPTPTSPPTPTSTMNATQKADAACDKLDYTVTDKDTLMGIALNYGLTVESLKEYNGLPNDTIYSGQLIKIPLCKRGPVDTVTPTPIPPYQAPVLLLPLDGSTFVNANDVITLQWNSVGELRQNEAYAVTIIDATDSNKEKFVSYVTDQKFIVPDTLRPSDGKMHIFRWSVLPVRQTGTSKDTNQPNWEPAGAVSAVRVFAWTSATPGETPKP